MKIGIVGSEGVVGSALKFGFELIGHEVKCHDIKLKTELDDVLHDTQLVFICLPTPKKNDGTCDISIVEGTIAKLHKHYEDGLKWAKKTNTLYKFEFPVIVIKSTIPIGTTEYLQNEYCQSDLEGYSMSLAFCPEFLKERSSIIDFTERHEFCIIGTHDDEVFELIKKAHGKLPKKFIKTSPSEAEASKYMWNAFNACRIVFANSMYEVCQKYNVDYENVKNAITTTPQLPPDYLTCNDKWRGYAGVCLEKDVPALDKMSKRTKVEFFRHIIEENEKYKKTTPPGMREK